MKASMSASVMVEVPSMMLKASCRNSVAIAAASFSLPLSMNKRFQQGIDDELPRVTAARNDFSQQLLRHGQIQS